MGEDDVYAGKKDIEEMRAELVRIMPVDRHSDWGPSLVVCRWCSCWLAYSDNSEGKPEEAHDATCFAVRLLKRPAVKKKAETRR